MTLNSGKYKFKIMKIILSVIFLFLINSISYSWEKIPIPKNLDKKKVSPFNFTDPFNYSNIEELDKFYMLAHEWKKDGKYSKENYQILEEVDGNKFLSISALEGINTNIDYSKTLKERGEINPPDKKILNKEIWYGFKMKLSDDFAFNGLEYFKFHQLMGWTHGKKIGNLGSLISLNLKNNGLRFQVDGHITSDKSLQNQINYGATYRRLVISDEFGYDENSSKYSNDLFKTNLSSTIKFPSSSEWDVYKIGIYYTENKTGFIKIFQNDNLILNFMGPTFLWKKDHGRKYGNSSIIIGAYRIADKNLPNQSIHFDDFTIVSDKKTLDKYLK